MIRSTDHPALCHVAKISMAVTRGYRRIGIGKTLLLAAEDWAHLHQIRKITLDVLSNNLPALKLYEKLHYDEEGRRKHQVIINHQSHDELLLAKFLTS